jgi:SAM-dependent methyltransferase
LTTSFRKAALALRERSHDSRAIKVASAVSLFDGMTVLDLGSGWFSPFSLRLRRFADVGITLADVHAPPASADIRDCEQVVLDPREALPFTEKQFDLVVCNSVIEHVTTRDPSELALRLPDAEWKKRAFAQQQWFAREIMRVGRRYFVQTPHRHFPLDLHLWLPFANWLPHTAAQRTVSLANRFWVKSNDAADWNLLTPADMQLLFPGATIRLERLFGVPKSIIAVG